MTAHSELGPYLSQHVVKTYDKFNDLKRRRDCEELLASVIDDYESSLKTKDFAKKQAVQLILELCVRSDNRTWKTKFSVSFVFNECMRRELLDLARKTLLRESGCLYVDINEIAENCDEGWVLFLTEVLEDVPQPALKRCAMGAISLNLVDVLFALIAGNLVVTEDLYNCCICSISPDCLKLVVASGFVPSSGFRFQDIDGPFIWNVFFSKLPSGHETERNAKSLVRYMMDLGASDFTSDFMQTYISRTPIADLGVFVAGMRALGPKFSRPGFLRRLVIAQDRVVRLMAAAKVAGRKNVLRKIPNCIFCLIRGYLY